MNSHLESTVHPGDRLDHYQIDRLVAHGRETAIFHGIDLRTGREVAIKAPLAEMEDDPTFADRFRREQEIAERLDHPGIAKVLPDPNRTKPFMVLEWFEGKTLRQLLTEEKRLAPDRAVCIAASIAHALEYLHARGIVHRDLRPENVMVDAADRVKLIDFGGTVKTVARRLTFTKIAQIAGESDYISPEELIGKRADARSDLYSLGMILYEMVTGELPFSPARQMDRVSNFPVPPREIDPAISPQLQEVIYRALERAPANRYASAHEFARDLEHLDEVGVADRPELHDWKKRRASRQRRVALYAAVALIPAGIFGLLLYFARH